MFIIIVFWLGNNRPSGLLFSCPLCFFPYSRLSSYLLCCFFLLFNSCCSHSRVFGKTLCMSSPFPIAILNDTYFFASRNSPCCGRSFAYQNLIILLIIIIIKISEASPSEKNRTFTKLQSNPTSTCATENKKTDANEAD